MNRHVHTTRYVLAVLVLLAVFTAAYSSGSGSASGTSAATAGATAGSVRLLSSKPCGGTPLKFTTILTLSGPNAAIGKQFENGSKAAVDAVNRSCALGRPLRVTYCDDGASTNTSLACGRTAQSSGSLAILGSVGSFDNGATASGLPGIYLQGTSPFEVGSTGKGFSSSSGLIQGIGGTSATVGLGVHKCLLVQPNVSTFTFAAQLIQKVAAKIGGTVDPIFYPAGATDFAPLAAQIAATGTKCVGFLPLSPVPMIRAFAEAGVTPKNDVMLMPSAILTSSLLKQLGSALNGMLVTSQILPPTDTANPGIALFQKEMKADGQNPNGGSIDFNTVLGWSDVKQLEGALLAAGKSTLGSLTPDTLLADVKATPGNRPEVAPFNFTADQLPDVSKLLGGLPIYSRKAAVLEIQNQKYKVISKGFIDVEPSKPPHLTR